jgi:uncharacterized protein (DUF302 family)
MSDTEFLIKRFPHEVVRIDVPLKGTFDQATQLYESIAPQKDFARVHQLVDAQASWDQVLEQVAENAPHGFMIYWRLPDTPLMRLAGDDYPFIGYLMGNHTVAQRMFHYDPAMMLHAPLRTVIYDRGDGSRFATDIPSSIFASYGDPRITEVDRDLDRRLAHLLELLDAPVPEELR